MKTPFLICALLFTAVIPGHAENDTSPPMFVGTMSGSKEVGILKVKIVIPKARHSTALKTVRLRREADTGVDLNIPVSFMPVESGWQISFTLPFELSKEAVLQCMHAAPPSEDGSNSISSLTEAGPIYEIPLKPNTPH